MGIGEKTNLGWLGGVANKLSGAQGKISDVANVASKIPVVGSVAGYIAPYLGKAKAFIILYLIGTGLIAGSLSVASLIFWLRNGIFNTNSPTGKQCYYSYDLYPQNVRFTLSSKGQNVIGKYPKTINEEGQFAEWVNTGFVTTGEPLEVYVTGKWYPFGRAVNGKTLQIEEVIKSDTEEGLPDDDGGLTYDATVSEVDVPCVTTTDLGFYKDKSTNPWQTRQVNHLMRYRDFGQGIDAQVEKIIDVHCLGIDSNLPGDICTQTRVPGNTDFVPCYLDHGHGVYMRVGNVNYAYHLANHEISFFEKKTDAIDGTSVIKRSIDETGKPKSIFLPFTLPSKTYTKFTDWLGGDKMSFQNSHLTPVGTDSIPDLTIAAEYTCPENQLSLDPDKINETCPVVPDQPIYVKVNDIYYADNEGDVEIIFKSGAKKLLIHNNFYDGSVFTKIALFVFKPLFGEATITGKSIVSVDSNTGAFMQIRNMILSNFTFQVFRMLLVIIYVTMYGYMLIKGDIKINENDIVKRGLDITFALWATEPLNYEFIDRMILPFFFGAFNQLSVAMAEMALSFTGIDAKLSDPFGAFDVMFAFMYSDVIGLKIMSLFNTNFVFVISLLLIFIFMVAITILMFRTAISYALSIFMLGFVILISPLIFLMLLSEYTKGAFDAWKKILIQEAASSVVSLFFATLFFCLILKLFAEIFAFDICWQSILSFKIDPFFAFNIIYGWKISSNLEYSKYFLSLLIFALVSYMLFELKDKVFSLGDVLFGGSGITNMKDGEAMMENIQDTLTGGGKVGFGMSPQYVVNRFLRNAPYGDKIAGIAGQARNLGQGLFNAKNLPKDLAKQLYNSNPLGSLAKNLSNKVKAVLRKAQADRLENLINNYDSHMTETQGQKLLDDLNSGKITNAEYNAIINRYQNALNTQPGGSQPGIYDQFKNAQKGVANQQRTPGSVNASYKNPDGTTSQVDSRDPGKYDQRKGKSALDVNADKAHEEGNNMFDFGKAKKEEAPPPDASLGGSVLGSESTSLEEVAHAPDLSSQSTLGKSITGESNAPLGGVQHLDQTKNKK